MEPKREPIVKEKRKTNKRR